MSNMNGSKSRLTLTNLTEPQQVRELNRQLSWIWDQLLGGLSMKSMNEDTRDYIDGIDIAVGGKLDAGGNAAGLDTAVGDADEEGVRVKITSSEFSVNVPGELGDFRLGPDGGEMMVLHGKGSITAPDVARRYGGKTTLYVDPAATGEQVAAGTHYRSLKDALAAVCGRVLDENVTIYLAAGMNEYGDLSIEGLSGTGMLLVSGDSTSPATLHGQLTVNQAAVKVRLEHVQVVSGAASAVRFAANACLELFYCVVKAGSGNQNALEGSDLGHVTAEGTTFTASGSGYGAYLTRGCTGVFVNSKGTGALVSYRSFMDVSGTVPTGGVQFIESPVPENYLGDYVADYLPEDSGWTGGSGSGGSSGGGWTGGGTTDSGGSTPEVQETVTAYYTAVNTDSYGNGWGFGQHNDVVQGWNTGGGQIRGCIWFSTSAMSAAMSGKTIKQASLRLTMWNGVGRGVAVDVELCGTTKEYSGRTGAPPTTTSYGMIGRTSPGTTTEITIPTSAVSDLVSGRIKALMLYSSDSSGHNGAGYSRNFARFDGETSGNMPRLTVTYQ